MEITISRVAIVTGGAGFIGTNLTKKLLDVGYEVKVIDNFRSSSKKRLLNLEVQLEESDLADPRVTQNKIFKNADIIFHLAADVDNRFAWTRPNEIIKNNVEATLNVGLAAKNFGISKIVYSSTGTIYGDNGNPPFNETEENSKQSSIYGSTKYSGEGILSVISTHFDINVRVFRFVGVLGQGYTHGHVFDFVKSLIKDSKRIKVLGDGNQKNLMYTF